MGQDFSTTEPSICALMFQPRSTKAISLIMVSMKLSPIRGRLCPSGQCELVGFIVTWLGYVAWIDHLVQRDRTDTSSDPSINQEPSHQTSRRWIKLLEIDAIGLPVVIDCVFIVILETVIRSSILALRRRSLARTSRHVWHCLLISSQLERDYLEKQGLVRC